MVLPCLGHHFEVDIWKIYKLHFSRNMVATLGICSNSINWTFLFIFCGAKAVDALVVDDTGPSRFLPLGRHRPSLACSWEVNILFFFVVETVGILASFYFCWVSYLAYPNFAWGKGFDVVVVVYNQILLHCLPDTDTSESTILSTSQYVI